MTIAGRLFRQTSPSANIQSAQFELHPLFVFFASDFALASWLAARRNHHYRTAARSTGFQDAFSTAGELRICRDLDTTPVCKSQEPQKIDMVR
jgi:hypothetical protein